MLEAATCRKRGTINRGAVGGGFACRALLLLSLLSPTLVESVRFKRRLGESASPEGLIASLRTREVAEPAL